MTLITAIGCSDGVVLAADSSGSDLDVGTQQLLTKIKRLGNQPILYGGSGDVGLLQKIDESLFKFTSKHTLKSIRQEIRRCVIGDYKEALELHAPYPHPMYHTPPPAILLFAGITNQKPWILEIEKDCRDTCYGSDMGNFCAIGSGKPLAQAIFRPHLHTERNLVLGKIFAYRVLDDAIKLSAGNVDYPIRIYTIDLGGAIHELSDLELTELKNECELWRELERDAVKGLISLHDKKQSPNGKEIEPKIPKPT